MQPIFSREPILPPGGEAITKIKSSKALAGCLKTPTMSGATQDIPKLPHNNS